MSPCNHVRVCLCVSVHVCVCICVECSDVAIWTRLFRFSGEGNGNPLQCSCLENPREGSLVSCRLWGRTESDTTEATWRQQQQQGCAWAAYFSPPLVPDSPHPLQYVSPDVSHICVLCAMPFPATCFSWSALSSFLRSFSADPSIL